MGRSSAATLTKEDKSIEVESGAMTDYEEEITLPETTSFVFHHRKTNSSFY